MQGPARTKSEQRRIEAMHERGCVPCWLEAALQGRKWVPEPGDVHHVMQKNHALTYINCPWHHRGVKKNYLSKATMDEIFGPSMALDPARYRARYGTEEDLLGFQSALLLKSPRPASE